MLESPRSYNEIIQPVGVTSYSAPSRPIISHMQPRKCAPPIITITRKNTLK